MPVQSPPSPAPRVSGLGVLAELESIEPILKSHQEEFTPKLAQSLDEEVKSILPAFGIKDEAKKTEVAAQIAQESAREIYQNAARIQDLSQLNQVVADSLTQSLITHPETAQKAGRQGEEKIYNAFSDKATGIVAKNQQDLEKAAVLGNLAATAKIEKPDQNLLASISRYVDETVETQAPLLSDTQRNQLKGNLANYLQSYKRIFKGKLLAETSKGQIPSFERVRTLKEAAHNFAVAEIGVNFAQTSQGRQIESKIGFKPLAASFAQNQGLQPVSPDNAERLGLGKAQPNTLTFAKRVGFASAGVGIAMGNSDRMQKEAYFTLLAHDKEKLGNAISQETQKIEQIKKQKSLSFKDRKTFFLSQKKLNLLHKAQEFSIKQNKRFQTYSSYFQSLPPARRLTWASQSAWGTTQSLLNQHPGIYVPQSIAANPRFLAGRTFGSLSFGLGNFNLSFSKPILGMGKGVSGFSPVSIAKDKAVGTLKRMAQITGGVFGGLALYFLSLGQAAMTGFLIGSAIGGTIGTGIGAYMGLQIALATGPFAPLTALVTVPLGGFIGGTIGAIVFGTAGGLIALGIASGSATAVSMGVGAGVGGTIGAYAGFAAGTFISQAFMTAAIAACISTAIGCVLIPIAAVAAPVITMISTAIGAMVGTLAGAALGYVVGHYIITPAKNLISGIFSGAGGFAGGVWGAITSFAGGVWGGISGLAGGLWGGLGTVGGGIWGGISGVGNFIVSGLGSFSLPASAASIPVLGGMGVIAVGGTIVGLVTASTFFNKDAGDQSGGEGVTPPVESQFVILEKTVSAPGLSIPPATSIKFGNNLPQILHYEIKITAKTKITINSCNDTITYFNQSGQGTISTPPLQPTSQNCNAVTLDAGNSLSFSFDLTADSQYHDSTIINKFTINGSGQLPTGTNYYIPLRDQVLNQSAINQTKQDALNNYPDNLINASCPGGQTCWDYVISTAKNANANPTLLLAIWYEESHFSDVGNHFSCPASQSRPHDGGGLAGSLTCFLNNIIDSRGNDAGAFIDAMNQYCGTGPWGSGEPLCENNPNFLSQLRNAYEELGGTVIALPGGGVGTNTPFTAEATAITTIGNPPSACPHGWPTTGAITQGPEGATSHAPYSYEALDIGPQVGEPVYSTVDGTVTQSFVNNGNSLDQRIAVTPTSCPGLNVVYFWHLSARSVNQGDQVHFGDQIAESGQAGTGPHIHYQFNDSGNRSFSITQPPNVPQAVLSRDCDGVAACGVTINSAP